MRRFRAGDEPHTAVGRLVAVDPSEDVWVVESLTNPIAPPDRWSNCQWIAFPADPVQVIDFTRGC
jgi:hypothetical protein